MGRFRHYSDGINPWHQIISNAIIFLENCLHMLRDGVMCQADTTLLTMAWGKHGPLPISNFTSPHECVNWDRLMEWVEPRSFDAFEEGMLVHPKFGTSLLLHSVQSSSESHLYAYRACFYRR